MAKLAANVFVEGAGWYGPSYDSDALPADLAEQVTNPAAFAPGPEAPEKAKSRPRSSSGGE